MKVNYSYPKSEIEFYSRQYSIGQLVENYDFPNLMAYYLFGMNSLKQMDTIIEDDLFDLVGRTQFQVEQDKSYFLVRTYVIKTAMEKLTACSVFLCSDSVMVTYNN